MQHTKWEARSRSISDGALIIADSDHNEICCLAEKKDRHYGEADKKKQLLADHIVRCVNSHDALVSALEVMLYKAYKQNWNDNYPEEVAQARAALAAAKAE